MPKRRPRTMTHAAISFARCAEGVRFSLAGESVIALADAALWAPQSRALIVSDLHFEKGSSFAQRGQFLPPYDTRATLQRLETLMNALRPLCVVALGDSFHDQAGPGRLDARDHAHLQALVASTDWVWIEGNHDPAPPPSLGGRVMNSVKIDAWTLRHEPSADDAHGEICGHLHPCAKIVAKGRAIRARCFATDGRRLVMPAFGAFTGGLNICDDAFARVFPSPPHALLAARGGVHPIAPVQCIPDAR
jgi:hypothetical protein